MVAVFWLCLVIAAGTVPPQVQSLPELRNPLIASNAPDPGVLVLGGRFWAATTSGSSGDAFPIWTASTLSGNWTLHGHVFPSWRTGKGPTWAQGDFWAPELHVINASIVGCYFTARARDGTLSIGVAWSRVDPVSGMLGKEWSTGPEPLLKNGTEGTIDATVHVDAASGSRWLVAKDNGNAHGDPTPISAHALDATGLRLAVPGRSFMLITNDQPWEGALVEAPWLFRSESTGDLYLFYSFNGFTSPKYGIGVAISESGGIEGPWRKRVEGPVLHTRADGSGWQGPGHCSVVRCPPCASGGNARAPTVIVYHAWQHGKVAGGNPRMMLADRIVFPSEKRGGFPTAGEAGDGTPSGVAVTSPCACESPV